MDFLLLLIYVTFSYTVIVNECVCVRDEHPYIYIIKYLFSNCVCVGESYDVVIVVAVVVVVDIALGKG